MAKAISASQNGLKRVYTNDDGSVTVLDGGGRNWRNNNPGNIKYGDNAKAAGAIGRDNEGFAIFPDYQSGLQGMLNVLKRRYGNSTIDQAMQNYAPQSENDTTRYTAFLKERVGVPDSTLIRDFTPDELDRLVSGIPIYEGWRAGAVTGPDPNMGGPAQRAGVRADPFQRGGRAVPYLAQAQTAEPAFGATSWPSHPASPNELSPDDARRFAGAQGTAPIPFVDGATRAQQALDNSLPAPGASPWDLSDRFGNWRGLGGVFGAASSGGNSGLGRTDGGNGLGVSNERSARMNVDPSTPVQRRTASEISGGTLPLPPARFPLEALLAPDPSGGLNEWASFSRGRSTPSARGAAISVPGIEPSNPDQASAGGLLGLIQDYMRNNGY
ncbi:hypothetical protein [Bradyrhizobium sp. 21]|uniref:hypothetical protein n=1 Tax=Bradyrhizobium sp. 21 TaxID=2782666 RepID=UPI001FFBFCAF|nr:hypothetical protein [Bradyrhizobium sp. 21]MCK1387358.1 hypothetical protein [Bradyrhizobium sp. 21]